MRDDDAFRKSLSAEGLDEIEPFLPYLLQDLWALGGSPEDAIALVERAGVMPGAADRVVDLGCGKGAMLIALAKRFGCRGYGVDLMAEFVDDARAKAREHGVERLVEFAACDMREAVGRECEHAWIVYGHDALIFGELPETLRALRRALRPGGHLILDAICRVPGAGGDAAELPLLEEMPGLFARCGLIEIARLVIPVEEVREANDANTAAIARRAAELTLRHPERAGLFEEFARNQREESAFLENECVSSYFLLRAG